MEWVHFARFSFTSKVDGGGSQHIRRGNLLYIYCPRLNTIYPTHNTQSTTLSGGKPDLSRLEFWAELNLRLCLVVDSDGPKTGGESARGYSELGQIHCTTVLNT